MIDIEEFPSDVQEIIFNQIDDYSNLDKILNILEKDITCIEEWISYLDHHKKQFVMFFDFQDRYIRSFDDYDCKAQMFEQRMDIESLIQWYNKNDYDLEYLEYLELEAQRQNDIEFGRDSDDSDDDFYISNNWSWGF